MDNEENIRRDAGCAILFLFDLAAAIALLYFAFGADIWLPTGCPAEYEPACSAARNANMHWFTLTLWTTVAANVAFVAWAILAGARNSENRTRSARCVRISARLRFSGRIP